MFGIGSDVPILDDIHGLVVYEDSEPQPRFASAGAQVGFARSKDAFVEAFLEGFALADRPTPSQILAMEIYNLSHFESSLRARFVTLITAVECISKPQDQASEIKDLVERLTKLAEADDVIRRLNNENRALRESFLGRLKGLKKESIGKACERIVFARLGESGKSQFKEWYDTRSKIVHTGVVPDGINVGSEVTRLDEMVSQLLLAEIEAVIPR
jgi:hypothetical protein